MMLNQLICQYISYRKSLGEKFKTNEACLKAFCKNLDPSMLVEAITEEMINNFLYTSTKTVTPGWFIKHTALLGFYQYALTRNYVTKIPLPKILPKRLQAFTPYIYSREELKLLFDAALTYPKNKSLIAPKMVHAVLMLIYALGLRPHETLAIKLGDIDLDASVITIQQSKFYKSRLVPFNGEIKAFIIAYLQWRDSQKQTQSVDSYLFIGKDNQPFNLDTMRQIFQRIRKQSGIKRVDKSSYQPRMHDLRHTFAVNRLTSWYQENKNVQQLLPVLSIYLGHTHLACTTVYLSMTDKILQEANMKFEGYAFTGEKK